MAITGPVMLHTKCDCGDWRCVVGKFLFVVLSMWGGMVVILFGVWVVMLVRG